jgi:hypothetical protein
MLDSRQSSVETIDAFVRGCSLDQWHVDRNSWSISYHSILIDLISSEVFALEVDSDLGLYQKRITKTKTPSNIMIRKDRPANPDA